MKKRRFLKLTVPLAIVLAQSALWVLVGQIAIAGAQPNAKTTLLPLQEWGFMVGNFDGPTTVEIEQDYGFVRVSTTHPRVAR